MAAARAREALKAKFMEGISECGEYERNKDDNYKDMSTGEEGSTSVTKDQRDREEIRQLDVQTEQVIMTSKALCDIGRDVAERLVMDGQERFAMSVLLDCVMLESLEPTTVIALLVRYIEIGLVVIDSYAHLLKGRLDYRGRGMKDSFEESLKEDLSTFTTADVFQQSSVVTYLNTLRRYKEGEKNAGKLNDKKERKRAIKSNKVKEAR